MLRLLVTRHRFLPAVALFAVTCLAYLPAANCGFIWDDDDYVIKNGTLRTADGLRRIWFDPASTPQYYPLVHTTFWIEYQIWGLNPRGYHVTNVVLHVATALLLWRLLHALRVPGSWLVAAVFALHPVHVESVAWITERKNVLSGMFYMAAALAYVRFASFDANSARNTREQKWGLSALSFLLFIGALLSKTVTASLPAALLVLTWWRRGTICRRDVLLLIPMFVAGVSFGLATVWLEKHQVGAEGLEWDLSFLERTLIAGRAVWFYAAKLVWPHDLVFNYPRWRIDATELWQYVFPLMALAVAIALWLTRKQIGRGPLTVMLFFVGTLAPALGFFDVYPMRFSFVADHFQYLASIGVIALAVGVVRKHVIASLPNRSVLAPIAGSLVLVAFGLLTWHQCYVYKNLETLWRDTLNKNGSSWLAHNNLGILLNDRGQYAAAELHFREALGLKADFFDAHTNLAKSLHHQGYANRAIQHYQLALQINDSFAPAYNGLGAVFGAGGELEKAQFYLKKALVLRPNYPEAHTNLGSVYRQLNDDKRAIYHFNAAIQIDPGFFTAHFNVGTVYLAQEKFRLAERHFKFAMELKPKDAEAFHGLATALARQERTDDAIMYYRRSIELAPQFARAHHNLAVLLEARGERALAKPHFEIFERLKSRNVTR